MYVKEQGRQERPPVEGTKKRKMERDCPDYDVLMDIAERESIAYTTKKHH